MVGIDLVVIYHLVVHLPAWYDANDSYITLNTGNVSGWVDRSGNGLNLPDSGVSTRPVYVSSDSNFNSLPSVDFQADDNLESPSNVLLNSADGFTVYIVTKINSFPSSFNFLLGRINGTTLTQGSDLSVNTLMLNEKYIKYGIEDLSSDGVDGIYDWLNGVGSFTQDGFPSKSYYNETYKNGIIDILNGVQ